MHRDSTFPARLWHYTSVRIATLYTAAFLTVLLLAGIVTYDSIQSELVHRMDNRVLEKFRELAIGVPDGNRAGLIEMVRGQSEAAGTSSTDFLFSLRDVQGTLLAGRDDFARPASGLNTLRVSQPSDSEHDRFRVFTGPVGDMTLSVGLNRHDLDEVSEIMLSNFFWAALAIVFFAVGGAVILSQRLHARFDALKTALTTVSSGHWDARLPISARLDDIDDFSTSINATLDRLQNLMEAMRQVSADIAHDLKTPIGRLFIAADEALEALARGGKPEDELESIRNEARVINTTFEALLSISQIEGGARRNRFKDVDLAGLLSLFVDAYEPVAEDAGCSLCLVKDEVMSCDIHGDKDLINQLMANLVENALRHCPPGTRICVGLRQGLDKKPLLVVADDGPGIPADEHENVLRRLYRLEKSRTTTGSGLGLALVKAIVDLHDATLTLADNGPGLRLEIQF